MFFRYYFDKYIFSFLGCFVRNVVVLSLLIFSYLYPCKDIVIERNWFLVIQEI